MDALDDRLATTAEADAEYATNAGASRPDVAWILSDRDVWYRNPAYKGIPEQHPEHETIDFNDWPHVVWVFGSTYQLIKKGEKPSNGFFFGVYVRGKSAIFTDHEGRPRVALINNKHTVRSGPFFVTCSLLNGRLRFLRGGMTTSDAMWIRLHGLDDKVQGEIAAEVSQRLGLIPKQPRKEEPDIEF